MKHFIGTTLNYFMADVCMHARPYGIHTCLLLPYAADPGAKSAGAGPKN